MPAKKNGKKLSPAKRLQLAERNLAAIDRDLKRLSKKQDTLNGKYMKAEQRVQNLKNAQASA